MTQLVNLTPHSINAAGTEIAPSGTVARVDVLRAITGEINGIPVYSPTFGDVSALPDPAPGIAYVVSAMVRSHPSVKDRKDVFSPGSLVRDQAGVIVGCDGLDGN
jgi:hypothetical protein